MTAWTPAEIATSCWLDASDPSNRTIVSSAFSEILDKSGNSKHATQTTAGARPALVTSAQNGRDAARFDGSDDFMALASVAQASGQHIILAGNTTSISTSFRKLLASTPGSDLGLLFGAGGQNYRPSVFWSGNQRAVQSSAVQRKAVFRWQYTVGVPSSATTQLDGGTETTTTFTASSLTNWGAIGESGAFPGFDFYEMVILPAATLSDDLDRVIGYIAWRWGLQSNLPVDHPYKDAAPVIVSDDATATATPTSIGIAPGTGSAAAQRNIIATTTPASLSVTPGTGQAFVRIPATAVATPSGISVTPGTGRALTGAALGYPTYTVVRDSYRDPIYSRGKVVLSAPLAPGQRISVERKTPITQTVPFTRDEPFSAEGFEYAMDKITFIQQEIEGHACDCRPKDAEDDAEDYYYDQNPECAPHSCSALVGYFGVWDNLVWTTEPGNDDFPFPSSESGAALGCTNTVFGGNFNKTTAGASLSPDYCDLTPNWCLISAYAPGIREPGFITTGVLDENTISVAMVIGPASGSSRITGTLFNNQHTLRFSYNGVGGNNLEARVQVVASGVDAGAGVFTDTKITLIIWHAFGTGSHYNQEIVIGDVSEPLLVVVKGNISDPIIGATTIKYAIDAMLSVTGKNFGTQTVDYSETITRVSGGTISGAFSVSSRTTWIAQAADLNMYGIHVSQDGSEIDANQARLAYLRNFTDYESPDYCIFPKD